MRCRHSAAPRLARNRGWRPSRAFGRTPRHSPGPNTAVPRTMFLLDSLNTVHAEPFHFSAYSVVEFWLFSANSHVLSAAEVPAAETFTDALVRFTKPAGGATACHALPSHCWTTSDDTVVPAVTALPGPDVAMLCKEADGSLSTSLIRQPETVPAPAGTSPAARTSNAATGSIAQRMIRADMMHLT